VSVDEQFARLMGFYGRDLGPEQVREYLRILDNYPLRVIEQAVGDVIDEIPRFPTPRELRDALGFRMDGHQIEQARQRREEEQKAVTQLEEAKLQAPADVYGLLATLSERRANDPTVRIGERALERDKARKWREKEQAASEAEGPP